jgi:DNA-binding response OmpR family regulator
MPTILIVEDEAKMRRLLELNLGEDGFQTLSAPDAETALNLLRQNSIDLFPAWAVSNFCRPRNA